MSPPAAKSGSGKLPPGTGRQVTGRTSRYTPGSPVHPAWSACGQKKIRTNRREVFGTSGTRMQVRVYAGYELDAAALERSNFPGSVIDKVVPMGGMSHREHSRSHLGRDEA